MKSVLISIQPRWCDLIARGLKTVEVRKTRPKLEPPFKCYIYCTLQGSNEFFRETLGGDIAEWDRSRTADRKGKVIAEFICDDCSALCKHHLSYIEEYALLPEEKLFEYLGISGDKNLTYENIGCYGWHISELKIYDEPKNIVDFYFPTDKYCEKELCGGCPYDCVPGESGDVMFDCEWKRPLKRPPQSWCYVEEHKEM